MATARRLGICLLVPRDKKNVDFLGGGNSNIFFNVHPCLGK